MLADTRELVRLAYEKVGIAMPSYAWGQPWQQWLYRIAGRDAEKIHYRKNTAYIGMLREARPLAGRDVAAALIDAGAHVGFITSASRDVAPRLLRHLELPHELLLSTSVTAHGRATALRAFATSGTYIDDNPAGRVSAAAASWDFVLYVDDYTQLMKEITWTQ